MLTTIQNLTDVAQKVIWDDRIEVLQPYSTREVSRGLAMAFIERRAGYVVEYVPAVVPSPVEGDARVWIANATGNPFLPKKLFDKVVRKGVETIIELDNPLCTPVAITHMMSQSQIVQPAPRDPNSMESVNLPRLPVRIPPFQRIMVGQTVANWLIRRDQQQARHHIGKLVTCDQPADYEPNDTWPLDEIREYACFIDDVKFRRDHSEWGDVLGPAENELNGEAAVLDAKITLLHKLFFTLIDRRFAKPSRGDMKTWLAARARLSAAAAESRTAAARAAVKTSGSGRDAHI
jgi:hypothetical protein